MTLITDEYKSHRTLKTDHKSDHPHPNPPTKHIHSLKKPSINKEFHVPFPEGHVIFKIKYGHKESKSVEEGAEGNKWIKRTVHKRSITKQHMTNQVPVGTDIQTVTTREKKKKKNGSCFMNPWLNIEAWREEERRGLAKVILYTIFILSVVVLIMLICLSHTACFYH